MKKMHCSLAQLAIALCLSFSASMAEAGGDGGEGLPDREYRAERAERAAKAIRVKNRHRGERDVPDRADRSGNSSDKGRSFDNGCTVSMGEARENESSKDFCEAFDRDYDDGDGPNKGAVQGK